MENSSLTFTAELICSDYWALGLNTTLTINKNSIQFDRPKAGEALYDMKCPSCGNSFQLRILNEETALKHRVKDGFGIFVASAIGGASVISLYFAIPDACGSSSVLLGGIGLILLGAFMPYVKKDGPPVTWYVTELTGPGFVENWVEGHTIGHRLEAIRQA